MGELRGSGGPAHCSCWEGHPIIVPSTGERSGMRVGTAVPSCMAILCVLAGIGGCADRRDGDAAAGTQRPATWMDDVDAETRDDIMRRMREGAVKFYRNVAARSEVPVIAANAFAAEEMLVRTERGLWPETPVAVGAVLLLFGSQANKGKLVTDVCDLTRRPRSHHIYVGLPGDMGRILEFQFDDVQKEVFLTYSMGHSYEVVIAPFKEVLRDASPADKNGVRRIVVRQAHSTSGHLLLPDPSRTQMSFAIVNRAGGRSNAVPIVVLKCDPETGFPAVTVFDNAPTTGPFREWPEQ